MAVLLQLLPVCYYRCSWVQCVRVGAAVMTLTVAPALLQAPAAAHALVTQRHQCPADGVPGHEAAVSAVAGTDRMERARGRGQWPER